MRKSIRWRLAASFAGIALLATLTLGAVLLTIVRGFYARQEREYLEENARSLALLFGTVVQTSSSSDMIQTQVENLSFLSQSRIRLLDADGQVLREPLHTVELPVAPPLCHDQIAVAQDRLGLVEGAFKYAVEQMSQPRAEEEGWANSLAGESHALPGSISYQEEAANHRHARGAGKVAPVHFASLHPQIAEEVV